MEPPPAPRWRLLVVDDHPAALTSLRALLACDAIEVTAEEGRERAEKRLDEESFDLLITDLQLGAADLDGGLHLVRRAAATDPPIPVVVLTAFASEAARLRARALGATDLWSKGLPIGVLLDRLRALGVPIAPERSRRPGS